VSKRYRYMPRKRSSAKPIVIKIGGSTLGSHDTTLDDLVKLQKKGILPVVVHGGGNKITEWLKKMGISTAFVRGMRVTDAATLEVVIAALTGLVNKELVAAILSRGGKAIGLSGIDGGLIQAKIENHELGYVGEVVKVNTEPIKAVLSAGYVPVIAPGGFRVGGRRSDTVKFLNINGDAVASEIAGALKAKRLIFLTDVPGVQDSVGRLVPRLAAAKAKEMIASGVISGGMIPKVEACLNALTKVTSTQIIDGRSAGALLSAIESNTGGTKIEQ
jgi:acetylglutamate kinase